MSKTGQCRCGKVKFAFDGPVLFTAACHCRGCQQMTASAFSLSTGTVLSQFRLIEGETVLGGLRGDTKHHFCDSCKSWLYTSLEMIGDFVNVRTTMLDDVPRDPPFIEFWTSEKLPWAETGARHTYPTQPGDMDEFGRLMAEFSGASHS